MTALTCISIPAYAWPAVTLLAAGLGRSNRITRRTDAANTIAGVFFRPQCNVMVAVRGTPSGVPGSLFPGRPTRVQSPPQTSLAAGRGDSNKQGVSQMSNTTQGASAPISLLRKITAHRRMAIAALRADSSLSVRLARYNAHMTKARALEVSHG